LSLAVVVPSFLEELRGAGKEGKIGETPQLHHAGDKAGGWWCKPSPELDPRPATPLQPSTDALLPKERIGMIREIAPPMKRGEVLQWEKGRWVRLFSKEEHGASIETCLNRLAQSGFPLTDPTHGRQMCITVVETEGGDVVGCLTPHIWKAQRTPYGDMSRGAVFHFYNDFEDGKERISGRLLPNRKDFHSMLCDGHNICVQSPAGIDFSVNDTADRCVFHGEGFPEARETGARRVEVWALVKPPAPG